MGSSFLCVGPQKSPAFMNPSLGLGGFHVVPISTESKKYGKGVDGAKFLGNDDPVKLLVKARGKPEPWCDRALPPHTREKSIQPRAHARTNTLTHKQTHKQTNTHTHTHTHTRASKEVRTQIAHDLFQ